MKPVVVCAAIPECAILHPLAARVLERAFGCLTIHSEAADKTFAAFMALVALRRGVGRKGLPSALGSTQTHECWATGKLTHPQRREHSAVRAYHGTC
jgi:hypothetical protein